MDGGKKRGMGRGKGERGGELLNGVVVVSPLLVVGPLVSQFWYVRWLFQSTGA